VCLERQRLPAKLCRQEPECRHAHLTKCVS
jgi:hypothetical protein